MGIDSSTPSFEQIPPEPGVQKSVLSPSEEFQLNNPNFVEPVPVVHEWDPNARRAESQRGSGGGFAAATSGELESQTADVTKSTETRKKPRIFESHSDTERDASERPIYYNEPVILSTEQVARNKVHAAFVKSQINRTK